MDEEIKIYIKNKKPIIKNKNEYIIKADKKFL
jgi:hypothetical protein